MKRIIFSLLFLSISLSQCLEARQADGDSIRLSNKFMRELDAAFSFQQPQAETFKLIAPQPLTSELLHQWLDPSGEKPATAVYIPGLSGEDLLKDSYLWKKGQYGMLKDGTLTGIDVNALSKYVRPQEMRLRKLRNLAKKSEEVMDKIYPRY